ncbi:MAG: hypothetical protein V1783_01620 [Bacteroidota bacterium]|jgi:hypothetical protein
MTLGIANFFRGFARFGVLLIGMSMISVTIFTGALNYGITISSILINLPSSIPWWLLLFTLLIAWDFELIGGLAMLIVGIIGVMYVQASNNALIIETAIVWLTVMFAIFFMLSWAIRRFFVFSYA